MVVVDFGFTVVDVEGFLVVGVVGWVVGVTGWVVGVVVGAVVVGTLVVVVSADATTAAVTVTTSTTATSTEPARIRIWAGLGLTYVAPRARRVAAWAEPYRCCGG